MGRSFLKTSCWFPETNDWFPKTSYWFPATSCWFLGTSDWFPEINRWFPKTSDWSSFISKAGLGGNHYRDKGFSEQEQTEGTKFFVISVASC
jgi:hypothetical protein